MKRMMVAAIGLLPIAVLSLSSQAAVAWGPVTSPSTVERRSDNDQRDDWRNRNLDRRDNDRYNNDRRDDWNRRDNNRRDNWNQRDNDRRDYQRRVWIPGHWERGFLGIGRKWVDGHYEQR